MYVGKRYSFWSTLLWQRKFILIFLTYDAIIVALYYLLGWDWLAIPWQPVSLIGIAVAFYLGFKNNSSYDRLWEARKIWGGIVNSSRSFTVMVRDFISTAHVKGEKLETRVSDIHQIIVHRHVAWLHALTLQLRRLKSWEHRGSMDVKHREALNLDKPDDQFVMLQTYLSADDYAYIMSKGNQASHLLSLQSKHLGKLMHEGYIEDFRHMELQAQITELYTLQGKSERIKNFPFPRQYASVNYFFVCIFIILLPFAMLSIFSGEVAPYSVWLAIPFTVLGSWVFWTMEMIGDYSENPFEGLHNDVPITAMSRGIEIDIRQMLDETDLPAKIEPIGALQILP